MTKCESIFKIHLKLATTILQCAGARIENHIGTTTKWGFRGQYFWKIIWLRSWTMIQCKRLRCLHQMFKQINYVDYVVLQFGPNIYLPLYFLGNITGPPYQLMDVSAYFEILKLTIGQMSMCSGPKVFVDGESQTYKLVEPLLLPCRCPTYPLEFSTSRYHVNNFPIMSPWIISLYEDFFCELICQLCTSITIL